MVSFGGVLRASPCPCSTEGRYVVCLTCPCRRCTRRERLHSSVLSRHDHWPSVIPARPQRPTRRLTAELCPRSYDAALAVRDRSVDRNVSARRLSGQPFHPLPPLPSWRGGRRRSQDDGGCGRQSPGTGHIRRWIRERQASNGGEAEGEGGRDGDEEPPGGTTPGAIATLLVATPHITSAISADAPNM